MTHSLQLMLLTGKYVPTPAPPSLIDALRSVQITAATEGASGFQLTFALGKRSAVTREMLPLGMLDPQTRIIVMAVVGGMPHVLMDGLITRQDQACGSSPGSSTLTVTGQDISIVMDQKVHKRSHPGSSPHLTVMKLCLGYARYGIVPAAVPPLIDVLPPLVNTQPIQYGTDLAYLKDLAERVGYVFYIDSGPVPGANVAYWGPEVRAGVPQPALTVDSDAATNVESLSFGYDGLGRTTYAIGITEPNTKVTFSVPVPDVSPLRPPLAVRAAPAFKEEPLPDLTGRSLPEILLMGLGKTARSSDVVTAQGRLDVLRYGHVLSARRLVGVRGAGLTYDGLWYVRSVTHEIKRGEYKQSFSLAREGLVSNTPVVIP
ncbi:hypothetical protein FGW37_28985 [Streptomyces rectiverticillatus]|uniref:hypothetical protein n=1 Tax=Streptomyces rectiverticillatus TaxID=173860 RepID=UPI0015C2DC87|nr:hypothetical protein [Streptomyces rectiverticillatus]QLE75105.1 hypothetical protein FGW37_28985 [Streptomyces rectiverticillatus]